MAMSPALVEKLKQFQATNSPEAKAKAKRLEDIAMRNEAALAQGAPESITDLTMIKKNIYLELKKELKDLVWHDAEYRMVEISDEGHEFGGMWHPGYFTHPVSGSFHDLRIQETHEQTGSWRRSGKFLGYRIYINQPTESRAAQFKQMKDGSFRYADIARQLLHNHLYRVRQAEIEATRKANLKSGALEQVKAGLDHELKEYGDVRMAISSNKDKPVRFTINGAHDVTVEQAIELKNLLHKMGIGY